MARSQLRQSTRCSSRYRQFKNAEQIQGKCKNQTRNREYEPIILKLEPPAHLRTNRSKERDDGGRDRETANDTGRENQGQFERFIRSFTRLAYKTENLEQDDRQYARHHI